VCAYIPAQHIKISTTVHVIMGVTPTRKMDIIHTKCGRLTTLLMDAADGVDSCLGEAGCAAVDLGRFSSHK
jgi:hypothetical protein